MANKKLLQILVKGVRSWNQWRQNNPDKVQDLRGTDLSHANLSGADLRKANLYGTDLRDTDLRKADLSQANLCGTDLRKADLSGTDLRKADLCGADLSHANLSGADLSGAHLYGVLLCGTDLSHANLSGAHLYDTLLRKANLRGVHLRNALLSGTDLRGTDLRGTDLSGAYLRNADLSGTDLSHANLSGANLSGTDLSHANLSGTDLSHANLSGTDLRGADLREANLSGADLSHANLSGTDLRGADLRDIDLREANLSGADLSHANLSGTDLSGADLREANLADVVSFDANLSGTTLTNADLTRSRFIGTNLRDAVVDNARVTDMDLQRLRGLPKPPVQLRIQGRGREVLLTDVEAREFFHLPSIVEVYLTRALNQQELGCYHFHVGEMHHEGVATDVYFVGHRHENGGSVLRFQAKSYETIYQVLPDLLVPFRMAGAIDWKQTIQSIPAEDRGEAITALATLEPRPPVVEWRFARRMAEIFEGYRNAKVNQISEWGRRRLRIEIIENPEEVQRLYQVRLPEPWDGKMPLVITQGAESNLFITERVDMSNHAEVHGDAIGSAVGSGTVNARDITVYKNAIDSSSRLDHGIKQKLKEARDAIENAELSDADKADVLDELSKLTAELEKPEQDAGRVRRYWNHIKEVAPTVASILASAASLAKLLGGG